MGYEFLKFEVENNTALITINRPEKLNALNHGTLVELSEAIDACQADSGIRSIIITGAGERAFVAGADITQLKNLSAKTGEEFSRHGQQVFSKIENLPKPVIAAVNGFALGGGCELAMACHVRLASENARFGLPEIDLGILPGYGGTQRLPRLVGLTNALYLLLTGDKIDAPTALRLGLVSEVVPAEQLPERARQLADRLFQKAPLAVQYILKAVYQGLNIPLTEGLKLEAQCFGNICQTGDMKEGVAAFLEKRKPNFVGK